MTTATPPTSAWDTPAPLERPLDDARRTLSAGDRESAEGADVGGSGTEARSPRLTARGAATKARIVESAAQLMYVRGANAVTLDDVRTASGTSKSQLYHHFPDKEALVREVVALQSRTVLTREENALRRLSSYSGLMRWRDALVQANTLKHGAYGCAIGSLATELSDQDDDARAALAETFARWEELLAQGFERMRDNGTLEPRADPHDLAVGLMAALQGGYLLAQAARDTTPMAIALDTALGYIRTRLVD